MKFTQSGGQTAVGPADWFTGTVYIDGIRNPDEQSAVGCAHVRFTPGARTAWHSHPKGQTLYVTDGIGYVARRGADLQEIRPGDVVYIEPNEEHWHGATADRFMAHVAIKRPTTRADVVHWLDPVTDDEYAAVPAGRLQPTTATHHRDTKEHVSHARQRLRRPRGRPAAGPDRHRAP